MEQGNTRIYNLLKTAYKAVRDRYYYLRRRPYLGTISGMVGKDTSIISSNCFAWRIMQDLHTRYNSPTLGLYFMYPDYIEFLQHLEYYLREAKIEFVGHSKYALGDERRVRWKHWYPIGLLGGKVEIHFLHYFTEEEAAARWYRRAARVNLDDLFVVGMEQNLCTEADIKAFDLLPFKQKLFFSSKDIKGQSIIYLREFADKGQVGDPYRRANVFYKHLINYLCGQDKKPD